MTDDEIALCLSNYLERIKTEPPPDESFAELRARCATIGEEMRAKRNGTPRKQRRERLNVRLERDIFG